MFFYTNLTVYENLQFHGRMYDLAGPQARIQQVVEMVGMTARLYDRVGTLSRGMQLRISIARALLHNPDIVLLDEPETGLDQQALSILWNVLKGDTGKKRTILLSTHSLERALEVSDRLVILRQGRIVYQAHTKALALADLRQIYHESTTGKV